jgi:hypothetical protein
LDPIQDQPLFGVSNGVHKEYLAGTMVVPGFLEEGRMFTTGSDDNFVDHWREVPVFLVLTGDIEAEGVFLQSSNFHVRDFNLIGGNVTAPTTFEVTEFMGEPVEGTLEGRIATGANGAYVSPVYTLKGGGDLEGITLHMKHEGYLGGPFDWTAWFKAR